MCVFVCFAYVCTLEVDLKLGWLLKQAINTCIQLAYTPIDIARYKPIKIGEIGSQKKERGKRRIEEARKSMVETAHTLKASILSDMRCLCMAAYLLSSSHPYLDY